MDGWRQRQALVRRRPTIPPVRSSAGSIVRPVESPCAIVPAPRLEPTEAARRWCVAPRAEPAIEPGTSTRGAPPEKTAVQAM